MKKSLYYLAAASLMLVACDPVVDDADFSTNYIKDGQLLKGAKFAQFEDAQCTIPSETGNYIAFSVPGVSSLSIYQVKADGSEKLLKQGLSGGVFYYLPARGSELNQTLVFEYTNMDGSVVRESKEFTVQAALALKPEMALLAGYDEKKVWTWDTDGHVAWGNMGYKPGSAEDVALKGEGQWWGIDFAGQSFEDQQGHRKGDDVTGDDEAGSYMEMYDDGTVIAYNTKGEEVRRDIFSVENWNPAAEWQKGILKTKGILWPYEINAAGEPIPGQYEIIYLTPEKMCLVYPDGGDFNAGGWGEASVWHFKARDPHTIACGLTLEGKKWKWDETMGIVWGNMGYCGGDGSAVGTKSEGQWWGVGSADEFAGQTGHKGGDTTVGDTDVDGSYMIFTEKEIQTYNPAGEMVRNGEYTFKAINDNAWKCAELEISNANNGAIMWPYEINSEGKMPSKYEVVYLTEDKMTLVYPDGGDFSTVGSWGEASFWHFRAAE